MTKKELWLRLRHYHFDHLVPASLWDQVRARFGGADASTRAFADKLARKLGWNHGFALRALVEYKKFVYLGIISDFVVTPSRVIDQVWHEHLLFSRGYRGFCDDVIGCAFEHEPELTPFDDQTACFRAQYTDTLNLYRSEFGYEPSMDIWYDPKFDASDSNAGGISKRKRVPTYAGADSGDSVDFGAEPLHASFDGDADALSFGGFEGGDGGGAGASGSWGEDAGDGGDSGGDSSCSSCSSGCGGGD
ncbi:glycine-rich domain-containing protein [Flaviaesturariibacter terrae]